MDLFHILVICFFYLRCYSAQSTNQTLNVKVANQTDPGVCNATNHGQVMLVKDLKNNDRLLFCANNNGVLLWKTIDGSKSHGEFFNPGYDCSDIANKDVNARDGFYWVKFNHTNPRKVWCDMTTDGGGFMLIGTLNDAVTWSVPSTDVPVEPFGNPHWSSSLGNASVLDFRIQVLGSKNLTDVKAHWFYRLNNKRPLGNIVILDEGGCGSLSPGIGDISYVKDLKTDVVVTRNFRCSRFGTYHHPSTGFGWSMMNSCFQNPCPQGFAYHQVFPIQTDHSGGFSYSTVNSVSGMTLNATAFVGCNEAKCCGCYGPNNNTEYCTEECKSINGGNIATNVFVLFWVRSSLPNRVWRKCMEYQAKKENGDIVWYRLVGGSEVATEGRCSEDEVLINDGIVVIPDEEASNTVPRITGLITFRKDNQELYVRANGTWKVIAQELKVNLRLRQLEGQIQYLRDAVSRECSTFTRLTEANRNVRYSSRSNLCDSTLAARWYRFEGAAGTRMPTSCVPLRRCGGNAPGWMNGVHPAVGDGTVARIVCFHWRNNCCQWRQSIEVLNCGSYFIYNLSPTTLCNLRYCASTTA